MLEEVIRFCEIGYAPKFRNENKRHAQILYGRFRDIAAKSHDQALSNRGVHTTVITSSDSFTRSNQSVSAE